MSRKQPEYERILLRDLRANATEAETLLWSRLRSRQLANLKFRRQRPIDRFIADFCCDSLKLIIELDGPIHNHPDQQLYDAERQTYLEQNNYTVLRLTNDQIMHYLESSLHKIQTMATHVALNYHPTP